MASRDINDLQPSMRNSAVLVQSEAEFIGLDLLIYCTRRSFEEQARLFRNGRALAQIQHRADVLCDTYRRPDLATILMDVGPQYGTKKLTYAAPGQSLHNYGLAFDAVPMRDGKPVWGTRRAEDRALWLDYGKTVVNAGLEWAGNWRRFKEYPHAQDANANWRDLIREAPAG